MLLFFTFISIVYFIFDLLLIVSWKKNSPLPYSATLNQYPFISIIIAVRNEAENIADLLKDFEKQTYPKNNYEVIIIDDDSSDNTLDLLTSFAQSSIINIHIHSLQPEERNHHSPKKSALKKGIGLSKGQFILSTDGDCRISPQWIETYAKCFHYTNAKFISGPVTFFTPNSAFENLQCLELASLIGTGASSIRLGYPLMCNGANLGFSKDAFIEVHGYEGYQNEPSGDDVFLMQKIFKQNPESLCFLKEKNALVKTSAHHSLKSFYWQRKRWASKWNKSVLTFSGVLPVSLFVYYFLLLVSLTFSMFQIPSLAWFLTLFIIKTALDFTFLKNVLSFGEQKIKWYYYFILAMLYPFYVVFFGIDVHFGKFKWKERRF